MRIALTPVTRTCGRCTLCCKVLEVPELSKPRGQWCVHARKGTGCAIYHQTRPAVCGEFACLWLQGLVPESLSPAKIHGVVTTTKDNANMVIHEDPGYPGVARAALRELIDVFIADGRHYVIVATGNRRVFIGDPALLGGFNLPPGTHDLGVFSTDDGERTMAVETRRTEEER
jgi:hypothetical protein